LETRVTQIRQEHLPPERISFRRSSEEKARHLLDENPGRHTVTQLEEIFRLIDSDFWDGEPRQGRFGWVLATPTRNRILGNDIAKLNHFTSEVYHEENVAQVDELIHDLKFVGHALATILLYVRQPDKYNVFLRNVSKTLKSIYPGAPPQLSNFSKDYPEYNKFANQLRQQFQLVPQEVDVVLTVLHRSESHEAVGVTKTTEKHTVGFDLDYIPPVLSDLPRLARNDPAVPDASRKLEQKLWILGRMLGYDVEEMGQKRSAERVPDAIFIDSTNHYAVLVDAKAREAEYRIGTDDRAIVNYLRQEFGRLERERGVTRVHYMIVSSRFAKVDPTKAIFEIRKESSRCQSVCLVTPETLLCLLQAHLKDPAFCTKEMEDILMKDGYLEPDDIDLGE
jgi:hypothetical protein